MAGPFDKAWRVLKQGNPEDFAQQGMPATDSPEMWAGALQQVWEQADPNQAGPMYPDEHLEGPPPPLPTLEELGIHPADPAASGHVAARNARKQAIKRWHEEQARRTWASRPPEQGMVTGDAYNPV